MTPPIAAWPSPPPLRQSESVRPAIGSRQRLLAVSVISSMVAATVIATPVADMALSPRPDLPAAFATALVAINLLLATLLLIKGRAEPRGDTTRLGSAFLFVGLIGIAQTASPSSWLWLCQQFGFAVLVTRYAWCHGRGSPERTPAVKPVLEAAFLALVVCYTANSWGPVLPALTRDGQFRVDGAGPAAGALIGITVFGALARVARLRAATAEQLWLLVALSVSCCTVWLTLRGTAPFTLGWYLAGIGGLLTSFVMLLAALRDITLLYGESALTQAALGRLARRDSLTGLWNRRHFNEMLDQEFLRAYRDDVPLALVMIDVDCFGGYNDCYGHAAGDECLRRVGAAIAGALWRPADHAARFGGDEIAVVLPAADSAGAMVIAEHIRQAVAAQAMTHAASSFGIVTVSAGIASFIPGRACEAPQDLLGAADRALYQAKNGGRNRVQAGTAEALPDLRRAFISP